MIRSKDFCIAGLLLLNIIICGRPSDCTPISSEPVVIDTDMAVDDVMAITALLGSREIDIRAITTVEGSASLETGTQNLLSLLDELGRGQIPVGKGRTSSSVTPVEPPPWRIFSDTLGGMTPFPPISEPFPRGADALLKKILSKGREKKVTLLCLGPLTNIASLLENDPALKEKINKLVVQADLDTGSGGFNLFWDREATEKVFTAGLDIVCIGGNVTGTMPLTQAYFNRITSKPTGVASLFRAMFYNRGEQLLQGHFKLWDPVTACYLVRPEYFDLEKKSRRFRDREVFCSIAADVKKEKIYSTLADLWAEAGLIEEPDRLHGFEDVRIFTTDYVKAFHCHLGPYLMLGYRAGKLAVHQLGCRGHFDIEARVYAPSKPPASCFIDGVQLGSGCSMGKGNITAMASENIFCVFTSRKGEEITISLKSGLPDTIRKEIAAHGVEPAGLFFYHLPDDTVFEIKKESSKTPPAAVHPEQLQK